MLAPISVSTSDKIPNSSLPINPPRIKAIKDRKKSKYPIDIFIPDKNNLSFKNKNPKNIKTNGKRKETLPKYLSRRLLMKINEVPFLVNDKRSISPTTINPKAKIE